MSESPSNTLLALLAGITIGAGLGILFAPDSGRKTRHKIKEDFGQYSGGLQQQLQELNRRIRSAVNSKSDQLQESVDDLVAEAEEGSETQIEKLEARLEQLKARLAQVRTPAP